jgi:neuroligin
MPPVTVTPWRETRSATSFGPVCPQLVPDTRNETIALQTMGRGRFKALRSIKPMLSNQSEDCLYLNVYAPVSGKFLFALEITLLVQFRKRLI